MDGSGSGGGLKLKKVGEPERHASAPLGGLRLKKMADEEPGDGGDASASVVASPRRGVGESPCGELTALDHGDFFYCCPSGFPYYSRCDQKCYTAEAFNGHKVKCGLGVISSKDI